MVSKILNIEVKARSYSNDFLEQKLVKIGGKLHGNDLQTDTYFNVPNGRFKLREGNVENSLIYYERSDNKTTRESNILYEDASSNKNLKEVLLGALGLKIEVKKERKIYFLENIKIHFDTLDKLGHFVEIEAIDTEGDIGKHKLQIQCDHLAREFNLKIKDYIKYSYSDLITESFKVRIYREASEFFEQIQLDISSVELKVDLSKVDHFCYRVTTEEEYANHKDSFSLLGTLLAETEVGGRPIATYKLHKPLRLNDLTVDVVELPFPKINNKYAVGFEHAEIVIEESFTDFQDINSKIEFDISALNKKDNADIRVIFSSGTSIKFHHQSLEKVIESEQKK